MPRGMQLVPFISFIWCSRSVVRNNGRTLPFWDPWRQERPTVRARIISSDSASHPLDEKTTTDAPAKETQDAVFSNRRVLRAPLPSIASGSLVEEEQTTNENPLFAGAGTVERFYFGGSVPIEHTRLVLDAPSSVPIHYAIQLLPDLNPQRTESDGRVRMVFESGHIDAIEEAEPELSSDVAAYPSVTFSTGNSWQQAAEEYARIVDRQIANADLESTVARLISGKKAGDQKIGSG